MNEYEWLAERFEQNRSKMRAVAYRMLGSLSMVRAGFKAGFAAAGAVRYTMSNTY